MKITGLMCDNFLGIHSVNVALTTPVTLFAGANGAGKSSIREAVRMAMTGEPVRVSLKKEYSQLVIDGAKAGGALIMVGPQDTYGFNVPGGQVTASEGLPTGRSVAIALDGQQFSSMSADERRTFLFGLTGCKITTDEVRKRLTDKACDAAKIEAVLPMMRTGFPSACDFATEKAKDAKRDWRGQTGATYGPKAAKTWRAEKPAKPADVEDVKRALAATETEMADLNQQQGALSATVARAAADSRKRTELSAKASTVDALRANHALAAAEAAEYEPKVVEMRQRASGTARVGLIHDMARFINTVDFNNEDNEKAIDLLDEYSIQHGKLDGDVKVDQEAKSDLPEFERGLEAMNSRVKSLQLNLDDAIAAKAAFDALAPAEGEDNAAEHLTAIQSMLKEAQQRRSEYQQEIRATEDVLRQIEQADKKTAAAAECHADVSAWLAIADALAPDGIPGDLLAEALKPINNTLHVYATDTMWMRPAIAADMSITAAGRPYALLSESEKWRVDAMIAMAVAKLSKLKILMLDRVDVLDSVGRVALLTWLDQLADAEQLDTALLFATLKIMPTGLPATVRAVWIEQGSVKQLREAA